MTKSTKNATRAATTETTTTATSHRYYISRSPFTKMAVDRGTLELHDASEGVGGNGKGVLFEGREGLPQHVCGNTCFLVVCFTWTLIDGV